VATNSLASAILSTGSSTDRDDGTAADRDPLGAALAE